MPRSAPKEKVRILVVDDELSVRDFVGRVLDEGGYEVVLAADGIEALAIAERQAPFELILTDLLMPGMQGDELARRLRQTHPEVKILYLTGYSDRIFKDRLMLWEGEAFLDKPPTPTGILEAVALILSDDALADDEREES